MRARSASLGLACAACLAAAAGMGGGLALRALPRTRAAADLAAVASGSTWGQHAPPEASPHEPSSPAHVPGTPEAGVPDAPSRDRSRAESSASRRGATRVTGLAEVATDSYVDPLAVLEGEVTIAGGVWIGPFASVRAAEGAPIRIGPDVALGDAVVIQSAHSFGNEGALPGPLPARGAPSAVDIGAGVAIDAQAQLHGPVWIEGYTWIGPQALVAGAHVARGAIVEPGAVVLNVRVPPGCYVPAGALIDRQEVADRLPEITASYRFRDRGRAVLAAGARRVRAHTEARGVGP